MKIKILSVLVLSFCLLCCSSESKVNGEIFVATKGEGNFKLGAVKIKIFKKSQVDGLEKSGDKAAVSFLKPDKEAVSNADGKFSVVVPKGDYVAVAFAKRTTLGETESYSWKVPFTADGTETDLMLSNQNMLP